MTRHVAGSLVWFEKRRGMGVTMDRQGDYSPQALERLRFRRQFFLGPGFIEGFPEWTRMNIGTAHCLTVHPDLETCQASDNNKSITLLGFILDPNNPQASNLDILRMLVRKLEGCGDFWKHTSELGGRWILVANDGAETIVPVSYTHLTLPTSDLV